MLLKMWFFALVLAVAVAPLPLLAPLLVLPPAV